MLTVVTIAITTCAAVTLAFLAGVQLIMTRVLTYHFEQESVSVVLFGRFRPLIICYRDIGDVVVITWRDLFLDYARSGFRVRWWNNRTLVWRMVAVHHRDGRELMLTPADPEVFARQLREHVTMRLGEYLDDQSARSGIVARDPHNREPPVR